MAEKGRGAKLPALFHHRLRISLNFFSDDVDQLFRPNSSAMLDSWWYINPVAGFVHVSFSTNGHLKRAVGKPQGDVTLV